MFVLIVGGVVCSSDVLHETLRDYFMRLLSLQKVLERLKGESESWMGLMCWTRLSE